MDLPVAVELEKLGTLDRDLLHVFVAGPGKGEGIAVAMPTRGWIVVDGCKTGPPGRKLPIEEIVDRWSDADDPVRAMILTHPHADHVDGFSEILEAFQPDYVGVTGVGDPRRTLADEAELWAKEQTGGAIHMRLLAGRVVHTLQAIRSWETERRGRLLALHDGIRLPLEHPDVVVLACSPDGDCLRSLFKSNGSPGSREHTLFRRPNWMSVVLHIGFDRCSVVLGGDLPWTDAGRVVPSGWDSVLAAHPELGSHHGLKIPHHGSKEALHPRLLGSRHGQNRGWIVTPFNSSRLPRFDDDDGLVELLNHGLPVHQTSISFSKALRVACERAQVTRAQLCDESVAAGRADTFKTGDTIWHVSRGYEPLDPVWCMAFDRNGRIVGRWLGNAAFEILATASGN